MSSLVLQITADEAACSFLPADLNVTPEFFSNILSVEEKFLAGPDSLAVCNLLRTWPHALAR
jgi:hypothetical protein